MIERVHSFLSEIGWLHGDVVARSDDEAAVKHFVEEIGKRGSSVGGGKYTIERSPVETSASNGIVERAVQPVQDQARVMKVTIERRLGIDISVDNLLVDWMVEYAAHVASSARSCTTERQPTKDCKARKRTWWAWSSSTRSIGSRETGGELANFVTSWRDGVFLGGEGKTGELTIDTLG